MQTTITILLSIHLPSVHGYLALSIMMQWLIDTLGKAKVEKLADFNDSALASEEKKVYLSMSYVSGHFSINYSSTMIIATKTTVSLHLLQRLKEIGIDTVFGVPGDFNLNFLDVIEGTKKHSGTNNWSSFTQSCVFLFCRRQVSYLGPQCQ